MICKLLAIKNLFSSEEIWCTIEVKLMSLQDIKIKLLAMYLIMKDYWGNINQVSFENNLTHLSYIFPAHLVGLVNLKINCSFV